MRLPKFLLNPDPPKTLEVVWTGNQPLTRVPVYQTVYPKLEVTRER